MRCTYSLMGILFVLISIAGYGQSDTVVLGPNNIIPAKLKPGTSRYLVYFKKYGESKSRNHQLWNRTIAYTTYQGKEAIRITQSWDDKDTVFHTVDSYCDRKTMAPYFHYAWWLRGGDITFDFLKRSASRNNHILTHADTVTRLKNMLASFENALDQYTLNWHLDLEVFQTLPFEKGVIFQINFYDPGFDAPAKQYYVVSGTRIFKTYDGQRIACWLLTHQSSHGQETFWVGKKTQEVIMLEQDLKTQYRYKIKLPG